MSPMSAMSAPDTLNARIAARAQESGERVFCHLLDDGAVTAITYAELADRSLGYAEGYRARGVQAGECIAIVLEHSAAMLYAFVGALAVGAIPSFMPPPTARQEPQAYWESHRVVLARNHTRLLVTYGANRAGVERHLPELAPALLFPEDVPASGAGGAGWSVPAEGDVAFLQHTSGTTGLKKGIALSHRAVLRQLACYGSTLGLRADDVVVSWLPLYHDMGLITSFLLPMICGVPVVLMSPFEWVFRPAILFDAIARYRGTLVWLPNFAFNHLADSVPPGRDLSTVRAFINCSEPCRPATFTRFLERFGDDGVTEARLATCYAMAETVFAITQSRPGEPVRRIEVDAAALRADGRAVVGRGAELLAVGARVPTAEVRVVDPGRRTLPDGRVGEIAVTADFLCSGYFELPAESAAAIVDGWYYTGDLGFQLDGELYITGRQKDVLIVNGRNYLAHDLEHAAHALEGIKAGRVVAVGVFSEARGSEHAVIIAETTIPDGPERQNLARRVKARLLATLDLALGDVHLVPPGWIVKTTSGKLSRSDNLAKYLAERADTRMEIR